MTMILTSAIMVVWADVPDSHQGDFRRRRAFDISSSVYAPNQWETVLQCICHLALAERIHRTNPVSDL